MAKVRAWCFTLFPNEHDAAFLENLGQSASVSYLIYGNETCPTTQRHHFQGFVYFKNARTLSGLRKLNARWHVEEKRGTFTQAIEYCKKEGDWKAYGTAPMDYTEKATKSASVRWELAKEGRFEELAPESIKTYEYIYQKYHEVADRADLFNYWISGPSGCGKSSLVRREFPDIYWKGMSKWWDGYQHESTTILDDFDPSHGDYLAYYLKIWADHYAFNAEVKGGMLKIRPMVLCVTSQYTLEQCFRKKDGSPDDQAIAAISRRFIRISWCPLFKQFVREGQFGGPLFPHQVIGDMEGTLPAVELNNNQADLEGFEFNEELFNDIMDL